MRFKVVVEFIQDTDPDDFRGFVEGKITHNKIAKHMIKEMSDVDVLTDSIDYANEANTLKIVSVDYIDDLEVKYDTK